MTKKEFKEAMLRGLGRCVTAVRAEPEKYRELVLWACGRDIAYDAQSEGTRSWYVYTMVKAYPDRQPFIRAAEEALKKYRSKCSWDLLHLCELLRLFALDGSEAARQALEDKYREVLSAMFVRQRRPKRVFYELSDLEQLALVLADDRKSFLRIAKDFGRLYREKAYMEAGDFSWFYDAKGVRYEKTMERAGRRDEDTARFLQAQRAAIAAREQWQEQQRETRPAGGLSRCLPRMTDKETAQRYAAAYREQTQPQRRAEALEAFRFCPYPDAPGPVMEDTRSDCEALRSAAWRALERLRGPRVRQFALDNAARGHCTAENFALLVTNYVPEDGPRLEGLLREMIADKDWDRLHAAGMDIFRAFEKNSGIPHPKHLLPLLYEYTPCSCCRESAVTFMAGHRMLGRALLEECLCDSSADLRAYAEKRWNR